MHKKWSSTEPDTWSSGTEKMVKICKWGRETKKVFSGGFIGELEGGVERVLDSHLGE